MLLSANEVGGFGPIYLGADNEWSVYFAVCEAPYSGGVPASSFLLAQSTPNSNIPKRSRGALQAPATTADQALRNHDITSQSAQIIRRDSGRLPFDREWHGRSVERQRIAG